MDSYFENAKGKYLFIDTAGMRKKSKVDDRIEKFSVLRATMAGLAALRSADAVSEIRGMKLEAPRK